MINANEARINVALYKNEIEEFEMFEQEISELIKSKSEKGKTSLNIIMNNFKIRKGFVYEMISLGYECNIISIAGIDNLNIKWG
jgi:hypothetical protein